MSVVGVWLRGGPPLRVGEPRDALHPRRASPDPRLQTVVEQVRGGGDGRGDQVQPLQRGPCDRHQCPAQGQRLRPRLQGGGWGVRDHVCQDPPRTQCHTHLGREAHQVWLLQLHCGSSYL